MTTACVCALVSFLFRSVDGILKVDGGRNEFRPLVDQVDHDDCLNLPLVEARQLIRLVRDDYHEGTSYHDGAGGCVVSRPILSVDGPRQSSESSPRSLCSAVHERQ